MARACPPIIAAPMTAEEFERAYAERGHMTVEQLRGYGRVVRPCACDYEGCEGWMSVHRESWEEDQRFYGRPTELSPAEWRKAQRVANGIARRRQWRRFKALLDKTLRTPHRPG